MYQIIRNYISTRVEDFLQKTAEKADEIFVPDDFGFIFRYREIISPSDKRFINNPPK